jgi:tRNA U34 5-methylaminomethyl-2-thiouridine-forming methyltransferase MnmC
MYSLKLIETEDGSSSLAVPELNETYHSIHGALTESRHVFIKNGFRYLVSATNPVEINILEIGFGTGLNALLTLSENIKFNLKIRYTAIEPFPCPADLVRQMNYASLVAFPESGMYFEKIHECPWNESCNINEKFSLHKLNIMYQNYMPGIIQFNLVYYDAFAPNKQPDLWEYALINKTAGCLSSKGIMVTYSAKGQLKRDLKSTGLEVETLAGPPGKKEMVRAIKP